MSHEKVAVVTGSNKGIGKEIVKGLCEKFKGIVYLTARDVGRGKAAVEELNKLSLKPEFHQLDIANKDSIKAFAGFIKEKHGGLDLLVNNAAIAFKENSAEPFSVKAELTIATNYFGLLDVCHALFPLLRPHARVVNMSSSCGTIDKIPLKNLRTQFGDPNLTEEKLNSLMKEYVEATKKETEVDIKATWPYTAYFVSKIGVSALTFIQHRQFLADPRKDIVINAVHPGYVNTDMTNSEGTLTVEEGASAPLYLCLLPPNVKTPKGEFVWYNKKVINWLDAPIYC